MPTVFFLSCSGLVSELLVLSILFVSLFLRTDTSNLPARKQACFSSSQATATTSIPILPPEGAPGGGDSWLGMGWVVAGQLSHLKR